MRVGKFAYPHFVCIRLILIFALRGSLSDRLEKDDPNARRKVQTANICVRHRYLQAVLRIGCEQFGWQATSFRTKDEKITIFELPISIRPLGLRREIYESRVGISRIEGVEVNMSMKSNLVPVVESCTF